MKSDYLRRLLRKIPIKEVSLIAITALLTTYGGNILASKYQERLWEPEKGSGTFSVDTHCISSKIDLLASNNLKL
jgi:hypothetical protein